MYSMIKRAGILGIIVAIGVALSGIQAPSASADVCYLALLKHGNWLAFVTPTECLTQLSEYNMWWFYLFALNKRVKGTEYCAKLRSGEKGNFTNSECTTEGSGEFLKVKLQLPDIFPGLAGEKYPVLIEGSSLAASFTLETTAGQKMTGEGDTVKLEAPETDATGTFTAVYTNVTSSGKKCKTAGAKEGEVKSSGSYQVVRLSKTTSAIGLLFLPTEYTIECGTNIKVKGSMIASLSAGEEGSELTSMELSLSGTKGKEELTKYLNYEEEEVTVHPEVNFGLGFVEADEAIGGKVVLADGLTDMFKILGR